MDDQDDHPLASGSATETLPRSSLLKSFTSEAAQGIQEVQADHGVKRQLLGAPYCDGLQMEAGGTC